MVTKNSLLDGKQRSATVKRKDISFLNDVTSLFFFASFAIQQGFFVPCDRFAQRAHLA